MNESVLQEKLASFLSQDLSLDDFEDWFSVATWNAHHDSSLAAQALVGAIELRLDEYSNGHLSPAELRSELRALQPTEVTNLSSATSVLVDLRGGPQWLPDAILTGSSSAPQRAVHRLPLS